MCYDEYFLKLLQEIVAIPSVSGDEKALAEYLCQKFRQDLDMTAELVQVEGNQCNLIARKKGKSTGEKKLLLGGHIDTVIPADNWNMDPFTLTIIGNHAYGLGACDMKGGIAAQMTVLKRLQEEDFEFNGEIEFLCACDEERLSIGANDYVKNYQEDTKKADFAIFAEPHYDNIVVGAAGKILLNIEVIGKSGHAAHPEEGINAIDCLATFMAEVNQEYGRLYEEGVSSSHCFLRAYNDYKGYSLNIPEKAYAVLNKHLYVKEDEASFLGRLKQIYAEKVGKGEIKITKGFPYYPAYKIDTQNEDYLKLLGLIVNKYGLDVEECIGTGVTDGNVIYPRMGVPIVMFGPKGVNLHKANEYLCLDTAYQYIRILYDYIKLFFISN